MAAKKIEDYIHPDANRKLNTIQTLLWYVCVLIPFFAFTISAGLALLFYFADDNKSYNISNIGFAILIGLSSSCFSYYKLLENASYNRLHKDVQRAGEFFLISAIAFLISSALKYSWTCLQLQEHWFQKQGLKITFIYTFLFAEIFCLRGLSNLVDVLHIRLTTSK